MILLGFNGNYFSLVVASSWACLEIITDVNNNTINNEMIV